MIVSIWATLSRWVNANEMMTFSDGTQMLGSQTGAVGGTVDGGTGSGGQCDGTET